MKLVPVIIMLFFCPLAAFAAGPEDVMRNRSTHDVFAEPAHDQHALKLQNMTKYGL